MLRLQEAKARRLLKGGGVRLNNVQIDESRKVTAGDAIEEQVLVLRKGKKNYYLIEIS